MCSDFVCEGYVCTEDIWLNSYIYVYTYMYVCINTCAENIYYYYFYLVFWGFVYLRIFRTLSDMLLLVSGTFMCSLPNLSPRAPPGHMATASPLIGSYDRGGGGPLRFGRPPPGPGSLIIAVLHGATAVLQGEL